MRCVTQSRRVRFGSALARALNLSSDSALPSRRISFAVKDREDDDPFGFPAIVDAVGRPFSRHLPDILMNGRREVSMLGDVLEAVVDLGDEFDTELDTSGLIPEGRSVELASRRTMHDDGQFHGSARALSCANADALTSP